MSLDIVIHEFVKVWVTSMVQLVLNSAEGSRFIKMIGQVFPQFISRIEERS